MQKEIQIFLNTAEKVLNGRTFFIVFDNNIDRNRIKDKSLIKDVVASKEFDLKLLEADVTQQDGDFFHELIKSGKLVPKINTFHKNDPSIYHLDSKNAFKYLVSMLTADTKNTFWSPYRTQINNQKAESITNSFLDTLADKNELRFYKLGTNFILKSFDFWNQLGSDSVTVILTDNKLFFLFTNGGD